jgi:hypothetical protein
MAVGHAEEAASQPGLVTGFELARSNDFVELVDGEVADNLIDVDGRQIFTS